jgi:hypothetical protein
MAMACALRVISNIASAGVYIPANEQGTPLHRGDVGEMMIIRSEGRATMWGPGARELTELVRAGEPFNIVFPKVRGLGYCMIVAVFNAEVVVEYSGEFDLGAA